MAHKTIVKTIHFFTTGIWRLSEDKLSKRQAIVLKPLRMAVMTVKGFMQDNCALQASALTFYTLLSIVPVIAMAFGIAKGFGLEQRLEKLIYMELAGQEQVLTKVIGFARTLLENTKGGLIAGIGVVLLFWSAIKVLINIEKTFNHIWKVSGRSSIRKFTDYLAIMIISPLLMIVSSSMTVYITTQVTAITGKLALLQAAGPLIFMMLKILPFCLIWLLFILLYVVMPNTQVRISSAVLAGITAGTIYQITQGVYISAQVLVSRYNAIYGSFAALPFFLLWLQVSWIIVLLGAEITYAHHNVGNFSFTADFQKSSPDTRRRYALHILRMIIRRFKTGEAPLTAEQIARELRMPYLTVARLIENLRESGLVSAVEGKKNNGPAAYQPARDIHGITLAFAWEALDKRGNASQATCPGDDFALVCRAVDEITAGMRHSPANKLLSEI